MVFSFSSRLSAGTCYSIAVFMHAGSSEMPAGRRPDSKDGRSAAFVMEFALI
jgi:hypothetical protein